MEKKIKYEKQTLQNEGGAVGNETIRRWLDGAGLCQRSGDHDITESDGHDS